MENQTQIGYVWWVLAGDHLMLMGCGTVVFGTSLVLVRLAADSVFSRFAGLSCLERHSG